MVFDQGFVLVNKPIGLSTFDVIRRFKRLTGYRGKVGHAGTLDVFASGLVILLLAENTKRFDEFQTFDKEYIAGVRLGTESNTLDMEGVLEQGEVKKIPKMLELEEFLPDFIGEISQKIPEFSATKHKGQTRYKSAREGKIVEEKSKEVKIYSLSLLGYKFPLASLKVVCSSGTYIRQLTFDIFKSHDIPSFLFSLLRTRIGEYKLSDAMEIEDFKKFAED